MRIVTITGLAIIALVSIVSPAAATPSPVRCPVVVDRETGKFTNSRAKYRCYASTTRAKNAGYRRHSFTDDSCMTAPSPTPGAGGDYNLVGPGQRETVVFTATSGGTVTYTFPGGGEFEIKVLNASTGARVQRLVETTQARSSITVAFAAQSSPITVKVEGPGAWTVAVNVN